MKDVYIHPAAIVETEMIGAGTRIWAFTHILKGVSIGAHCNIGEHCFIEMGAAVGNYVTVKNGNQLWDGVTLADGVFVGPNVSFTNDLRPRSPRQRHTASRYDRRDWLSPTSVGEGASIGAGAIILAGNNIGAFSMIGAGALVTHNVAAHSLVVGAPARVAGWVCRCGCPLHFTGAVAVCDQCNLELTQKGDVVDMKATVAA